MSTELAAVAATKETGSPWRRWIARSIDVTLFGFIGLMVGLIAMLLIDEERGLAFAGALESGGPVAAVLAAMLLVALSVPAVAFFIASAGTPGKWLCGIKVVRVADGRRPTLRQALFRELLVWTRGFGLGVPLVSFGLQLWALTDLEAEGETYWDRKLGLRVEMKPLGVVGYLKFVVAVIVVLVLRALDFIVMATG